MAPIPDMSWAAALGFATGAPRFAEVGVAAGLAAVLLLTGVAGLAAGFFFGGALAAGLFMSCVFCIDCTLAGAAQASGATLMRRSIAFKPRLQIGREDEGTQD